MNPDPLRLNADQFPRRLDLEVSVELLDHLQRLSARSGRSIGEITLDFLNQGIAHESPADQPPPG